MSVESLKCKECASEYELGAAYFCERCFGPLEVKYDHSELDAARRNGGSRRARGGSGATPTSSPSRAAPPTRWSRA